MEQSLKQITVNRTWCSAVFSSSEYHVIAAGILVQIDTASMNFYLGL